jgi:hypothetical protein
MKWYSVKEKLPESILLFDIRSKPEPDGNWRPVSDGDIKFAIARYSKNYVRGKYKTGWRFWGDQEEIACPAGGDCKSIMKLEDIKFWGDIWEDMPKDIE